MAPRCAGTIGIERKAGAAALAVSAGREALAHVAFNVDGALESSDAEYVHQMRIGVRRLRVANRIARHAGLPSFSPRFKRELDWIWNLLGNARDHDVFVAATWPALESEASGMNLAPEIERGVHASRDRARRELQQALATPRFQRLLLTAAWIMAHQEIAAARIAKPRSARRVARRLLARSHERVLRRGGTIARQAPEERHALRRDAKKLRYLAEFVASRSDGSRSRRFLTRLAALQSVLGELNDYAAATTLITEIGTGLPVATRTEVDALLRAATAACEDRMLDSLEGAWKRFARVRAFWRKR